MKEKMNYEEAMKRLEQIADQMENNELGLDSIIKSLKEAHQLIKECRETIIRTDEEIQRLLKQYSHTENK